MMTVMMIMANETLLLMCNSGHPTTASTHTGQIQPHPNASLSPLGRSSAHPSTVPELSMHVEQLRL